MKNRQSKNAEDESPRILREFLPYFINGTLGMCQIFHNKLSFTGAGFLNLFVL